MNIQELLSKKPVGGVPRAPPRGGLRADMGGPWFSTVNDTCLTLVRETEWTPQSAAGTWIPGSWDHVVVRCSDQIHHTFRGTPFTWELVRNAEPCPDPTLTNQESALKIPGHLVNFMVGEARLSLHHLKMHCLHWYLKISEPGSFPRHLWP